MSRYSRPGRTNARSEKSYSNLVSSSSANGTKIPQRIAPPWPSVIWGSSTREGQPLAGMRGLCHSPLNSNRRLQSSTGESSEDNELIDVALRHSVGSDPLSGMRPTGCQTSPEEGEAPDASPSEPSFRSFGASVRSQPRRESSDRSNPRGFTGTHDE